MNDVADAAAASAALPTERLKLTEIFLSLQGEARDAGWPTVFVRLTGCPLRCTYCDTTYSFYGGQWWEIDAILAEVAKHGVRHVCVTGGEPLSQKRCLTLLEKLCDAGYVVSLETSGAMDIAGVDARVSRVLDIKTPGSGEVARNLWSNLPLLTAHDQVKAVICSRCLRCATCCFRPAPARSRRAHWPIGSSKINCRCAFKCNCTNFYGARSRADETCSGAGVWWYGFGRGAGYCA